MEQPRPEEAEPLTLVEMLHRVATGEALGFTVIHSGGGLSYRIAHPDETLEPEASGETLVPMSPDDALELLEFLEDTPPGEMNEKGTLDTDA